MPKYSRTLVRLLKERGFENQTFIGTEVGVWLGKNAAALLAQFPELRLHLVDPWSVEDRFLAGLSHPPRDQEMSDSMMRKALSRTEFAADRRIVHREESLTAAKGTADGSLDFVFIDACHLYESVRDDLSAWWPKIRRDDPFLFAGHDYGSPGGHTKDWGVRRAVDEFKESRGLSVRVDRRTDVWWVEK